MNRSILACLSIGIAPLAIAHHGAGTFDRIDPNSCYLSTIVFENGSSAARAGTRLPRQI
jgi:hypothetical protein